MTSQILNPAIKVLLVVDSLEDRSKLKRLLYEDSGYDYHFEETTYGEAGLKICLNELPDVILLDYHLPDINGLEFLRTLVAELMTLPCPVIVLTGEGDESGVTECLKLGVQDYLLKDKLSFGALHRAMRCGLSVFQRKMRDLYFQNTSIQENVCDGFFTLDNQERFIYFNGLIEEISGLCREEIFGKKLGDVLPMFENGLLFPNIRRVLAEQISISFESFLDFSQIWLKINLYPTGEGISVYLQNITGLKMLEKQRQDWQAELEERVLERTAELEARIKEREQEIEELRTNQELYRGVLDSISEGVVVHNPDGAIIATNSGTRKILGLSAPQMEGRFLLNQGWEAIHEDGSPYPPETLPAWVTLRSGKPCSNVTMGLRHPDGTLKWIFISSAPLFQPDGITLRGAVTSFRDITGSKLIEQSIEESEDQYRSLFNNTLYGVLIALPDGQLLAANPAACDLMGFKEAELIGPGRGRILDVVKGPTPADFAILQQDKHLQREFILIHKDGGNIEVEAAISLYRDRNGQERLCIVIHDIRDRKRFEEALQYREQEIRTLVENAPDIVLRVNLDLRVLYVNPAFTRLTGIPVESVTGKIAFGTGNHFGIYDVLMKLKADLLETGLPQVTEYDFLSPQGIKFYYHYRMVPEFNAAGQIETLVVIARDVTELKKTQVELLNQEHFRTLFEFSPDPVALFTAEGQLLSCNSAMESLARLPRQTLLSHKLTDLGLISQDRLDEILEDATQNLARMDPYTSELTMERQDQSQITFELKLQKIPAGDQLQFICTVRDITVRKQLETELREALKKQEELTQLKSQFITTTSHEFRTPLAIIQAAAESLEAYIEKMHPDRVRDRVGKMKTQIRQITKLLDDVLIYNRLQARSVAFDPVIGDLVGFSQALIHDMIEFDRNIHRFKLSLPETPLEVSFDQLLVRQVINNLLSNAMKYSPAGTNINVELRIEEDNAVFQVADQGIGIPEKDQARIFDSFYRAANAGTIQGAGMGLAILKEAINLSGGQVNFTSREGAGTVFSVSLPWLK